VCLCVCFCVCVCVFVYVCVCVAIGPDEKIICSSSSSDPITFLSKEHGALNNNLTL